MAEVVEWDPLVVGNKSFTIILPLLLCETSFSGQHPRKAGGDERGSTEEAQPAKSKRQKHFFVIKVKSHLNKSTSFNLQTLIYAFHFVKNLK